jgi:hypothetical protein
LLAGEKKPGSRFCEAALRKSYALHRARDTEKQKTPAARPGLEFVS